MVRILAVYNLIFLFTKKTELIPLQVKHILSQQKQMTQTPKMKRKQKLNWNKKDCLET